MNVLILGGYGNTGLLIARLLLQESDIQIVLAGRNTNRAKKAALELNREFHTNRVSIRKADAANINSLKTAFNGIDIIIVASSTMDYAHNVASAALNSDADYFDIQLSSPVKFVILNSLKQQIEESGRCFITDGGFHPGVPAAMVRYAAKKFDGIQKADISAAFKLNWKELQFSDSTILEFIDELNNLNPVIFKNKKWIKLGVMQMPKFNFGKPFGERYCSPMFLEEIRLLPDAFPSIDQAGFYIAGFNWVTDYIIMPIAFTALKMFGENAKKIVAKLFSWGLKNFSIPPYYAILQLEAKGLKDGQNTFLHMSLSHYNAYVLTAAPVVACLLQYIEGSIRRPGLWLQANMVEPVRFFEDIERLGIKVSTIIKQHS